jgi:chaperonin GroEL
VTIGPRFLNILASDSQSPALQRNLASVRHQMSNTEVEKEWKQLQLRLGRLQQGMGVIWVGAATETERDARLQSTERALGALRAASTSGVVPGAGATLLAVSHHLSGCESPGTHVVAKALEAPARWIARNAGLDPNAIVACAKESAPALGFDAVRREIVDLRSNGIVDPVTTLVEAVRIGLSTALLASDSGVLVQRPIALHQAEIRP